MDIRASAEKTYRSMLQIIPQIIGILLLVSLLLTVIPPRNGMEKYFAAIRSLTRLQVRPSGVLLPETRSQAMSSGGENS
ncbi:hypothetical protein [Methanogenium cariaci]|uniref:hypothetical protein n=1 Tax=Methanogenium cariaci TaxID=2197 RepID=UPI001C45AA7C|nr:hypothetical protein [Methanogenium cariaci]